MTMRRQRKKQKGGQQIVPDKSPETPGDIPVASVEQDTKKKLV